MKKLGIVNLSNYSSPEIKEIKNKDWIFYGEDNNYYQYLIDRYNGSPTNNAIVNGLSQMIFGKGLNATDSNKKPDQYAQMVSLFKKDTVRKFCYDLKLMGQCAIQVIYSKDRTKIAQVEHLPIETIRAEKVNEDSDEIEGYYYSADWSKLKPMDKPKRIPAFGTSKEAIEIICVKPYRAGFYYYSPVDYQGGLQYAELEEEIANYHLNNIKNGLAPSMLINFNNGIPNEEERELIEQRIYDKFSGSSSAGKFILSFNDNTETSASLEPVQLSDAHNQYQFLSDESSKKILVSHRIVSPMLFGIKDNTGLGNNAEELKTASILCDNVVVKPFQDLLIDSFDQILGFNGIALKLYFETLQPLEFTDMEGVTDSDVIEEETGVKMSSQQVQFDDDEMYNLLKQYGEDEDLDKWELVDEREVDYDQEEVLDKMIGLARSGTAKPNSKSKQDKEIKGVEFKVRYKYSPDRVSSNSREFCKKMVAAKKLYRKEDIIAMGSQAVNKGWGLNGAATYSIWLYKGGGACHHKWLRQTFKGKTEGNIANVDPNISTNKSRKDGFNPVNEREVSMKPKDMPNQGFVNK
tara:strand:- start:727 stop:2457 length:1731 start_codon:yes stop_codon:yes gene_type:complete